MHADFRIPAGFFRCQPATAGIDIFDIFCNLEKLSICIWIVSNSLLKCVGCLSCRQALIFLLNTKMM